MWRKSLTITQECCEAYWTSPVGKTLQNSSSTANYYPSRKLSKLDKTDMQDTAGEVRINSWAIYSCGLLDMEPIYNSTVSIQNLAWKTSREQWTIETGGETWLGRFVLVAWLDDDENCAIALLNNYQLIKPDYKSA